MLSHKIARLSKFLELAKDSRITPPATVVLIASRMASDLIKDAKLLEQTLVPKPCWQMGDDVANENARLRMVPHD